MIIPAILSNLELTRLKVYKRRGWRRHYQKNIPRMRVKKHYRKRRFHRTNRFSWDVDHYYQGKRLKLQTTGDQYFKSLVTIKKRKTGKLLKPVFGYDKLSDIFFSADKLAPRTRSIKKILTNTWQHLSAKRPPSFYIFYNTHLEPKIVRPSGTVIVKKKPARQLPNNRYVRTFFGRRRVFGRGIFRNRRQRRYIARYFYNHRKSHLNRYHYTTRLKSKDLARIKHTHYWQYAKNMRFRTRTELRGTRTRVPPGELGYGFLIFTESLLVPFVEFLQPFLILTLFFYLCYKFCYFSIYFFSLFTNSYTNLFVDALVKSPNALVISAGFNSRSLQRHSFITRRHALYVLPSPNFQPFFMMSQHINDGTQQFQAFFPIPHWFIFSFPLHAISYNFLQQLKSLLFDIKGKSLMHDFGVLSFNHLYAEQFTYTFPEWFSLFYGVDSYYLVAPFAQTLDAYDYWKRKLFKLDFSFLFHQATSFTVFPLKNLTSLSAFTTTKGALKNLYSICLTFLVKKLKLFGLKKKLLLLSLQEKQRESLNLLVNADLAHVLNSRLSHSFLSQLSLARVFNLSLLSSHFDVTTPPSFSSSNSFSSFSTFLEKHQHHSNLFFSSRFHLFSLFTFFPNATPGVLPLHNLFHQYYGLLNVSLFSEVSTFSFSLGAFSLLKHNTALVDIFVDLWSSEQNFEKYEVFFDSFALHLPLLQTSRNKTPTSLVVYDSTKYALVCL